ncbi:fungal-specific transcription factor domain-containing protein [Aspergillus californicus]
MITKIEVPGLPNGRPSSLPTRNHGTETSDYGLQEPTPVEDQFRPEVSAMGLATRSLSDGDDSVEGFFGDSSAIAFIKRLQETLRLGTPASELHQAPHGSAVQSTSQNPYIEGAAKRTKISPDLLPPRPLADHLVDCYLTKIHTLYPFVHKNAFLSLYESVWTSDDSQLDISASTGLGLGDPAVSKTMLYYGLNMIFAMGCQFSEIIRAERETMSEAFFHRCKRALDVDCLERGGLTHVQILLLMGHYLQGSQTPNRCWHAIGTAYRSAQALGLHSIVGDEHRPFAEKQIRRRVWHGCVMLDLTVSIMLGRPAMTSKRVSVPLPDAIDDCYLSASAAVCEQPPGTFSRVEWLVATLKMHELLREVNDTLYDEHFDHFSGKLVDEKKTRKLHQIQCTTQIDLKLEDFRLSLPKQLGWEAINQNDLSDPLLREKCLLKARYLYLRLLTYRPVLLQSLGQMQGISTNIDRQTLDTLEAGIYSNFTLNCSVLCAHVWFYNVFYVFTAGLVLILTEFHGRLLDTITREALDLAWDKCQTTLNYLNSYSVVAEKCSHSLGDTRSKCVRFQAGPNNRNQPADSNLTSDLVENDAEDAPYMQSLFEDIDFNNIALDWSWFDIEY